jgi:hypothetical protein
MYAASVSTRPPRPVIAEAAAAETDDVDGWESGTYFTGFHVLHEQKQHKLAAFVSIYNQKLFGLHKSSRVDV